MLSGFVGAVQFLTRVPLRTTHPVDTARCVPWFPVVGALIGGLTGVIAVGLTEWVPPAVAATMAIIAGLAITGAFHEDGLADTMDALGGMTPERRREILKDSRHGSYGVAAMCSTILLRVVCVASVGPAVAFAGLVAAHTLGRGASVGVMAVAPQVPERGLGADFARSLTRRAAAVGVTVAVAITAVAVGWWMAPLVAAATAAAGLMAVLGARAFGGVSGDILGAAEQVAECAVLVVVTALAARHPLWWA